MPPPRIRLFFCGHHHFSTTTNAARPEDVAAWFRKRQTKCTSTSRKHYSNLATAWTACLAAGKKCYGVQDNSCSAFKYSDGTPYFDMMLCLSSATAADVKYGSCVWQNTAQAPLHDPRTNVSQCYFVGASAGLTGGALHFGLPANTSTATLPEVVSSGRPFSPNLLSIAFKKHAMIAV